MIKIREALVVEGRYDQNTLAQIVDAPIFVTNGFGIFKDPDRLALLRTVAARRGLVILTDSDGAGFVIRNYLKGAIDPALVKHAYIPDVPGKEKRKAAPGKEGKLGVEGMDTATLLTALRCAGATFEDENTVPKEHVGTSLACPCDGDPGRITKTDLYELGLTGRPDSKARRLALQARLGLPERLSTNALLTALNCVTTREALRDLLTESRKNGRPRTPHGETRL